jgi:general secretion pathway protein H
VIRLRSAGFTLIEIMVVVFIIGLITAAAVISFGGERRDTELDREAERINALLSYVREQAELQTRDYGLRMDRRGYGFVVFNPLGNDWRLAEEDDAMREREWPEGLVPGLVVEGRPVVLDVRKPTIKDFTPQVMVFANGDLSSFEVSLAREGMGPEDRARIYSNEESVIQLLLPGETEESLAAAEAARPK